MCLPAVTFAAILSVSQIAPPALPSSPLGTFAAMPALDSPVARSMVAAQWAADYDEWKAWFAQWRNRREPGWFSARARRQPPEPPAWLPAACSTLDEDAGPMVDGCRAWREWERNDYGTEVVAQQVAQTRADLESPRKTAWWEHIHLDALWPMAQAGSSAFGVCGVHTTLDVSKRVQVFVAPGAILMRFPSASGGQTWTPATDWGFSFRLVDIRLPGTRRPSTLHLNLARVW